MRKCRCCRQSWPIEFYTVCRTDGLRRRTCRACRVGCAPSTRTAKAKAYRHQLRDQVLAVRSARAAA